MTSNLHHDRRDLSLALASVAHRCWVVTIMMSFTCRMGRSTHEQTGLQCAVKKTLVSMLYTYGRLLSSFATLKLLDASAMAQISVCCTVGRRHATCYAPDEQVLVSLLVGCRSYGRRGWQCVI